MKASVKRMVDEHIDSAYSELRGKARQLMRKERGNHTLTPTALVNEAYVRLANGQGMEKLEKSDFKRIAANKLRQILVDSARRNSAKKRAGNRVVLELDQKQGISREPLDVLVIDETLTRLGKLKKRHEDVLCMRIFGGMTIPEVSLAVGVSERQVSADYEFAKKWISFELSRDVNSTSRSLE